MFLNPKKKNLRHMKMTRNSNVNVHKESSFVYYILSVAAFAYARKARNIYYLAFYKESLVIPILSVRMANQ